MVKIKLIDYLKKNPNCELTGNNVEMTFKDGNLILFDFGDFKNIIKPRRRKK